MGAERVDYYSDDEYEQAKQSEEQASYDAMMEEEELMDFFTELAKCELNGN